MNRPTGPACGNNPNHPLTDGDRQAVADFKAYLADRAALRDRIDSVIREFPFDDFGLDDVAYLLESTPDTQEWVSKLADAVLAVLPPADRAAFPTVRPHTLASIACHLDARAVAIMRPDSQTFVEWQTVVAALRRMADETQPTEGGPGCAHCGGDHSWDTCEAYTALVADETQPAETPAAELLALATVLEIPRPDSAIPYQLRRSYGYADRWAICDREGRRWHREYGWVCEAEGLRDDEELRDATRYTLAEAVPLARKLAAGARDEQDGVPVDDPDHRNAAALHFLGKPIPAEGQDGAQP